MKRARFTEEQIVGILRENEAGAKAGSFETLRREAGVWELSGHFRWVDRSPRGFVTRRIDRPRGRTITSISMPSSGPPVQTRSLPLRSGRQMVESIH